MRARTCTDAYTGHSISSARAARRLASRLQLTSSPREAASSRLFAVDSAVTGLRSQLDPAALGSEQQLRVGSIRAVIVHPPVAGRECADLAVMSCMEENLAIVQVRCKACKSLLISFEGPADASLTVAAARLPLLTSLPGLRKGRQTFGDHSAALNGTTQGKQY
jgi:hypothetical protein